MPADEAVPRRVLDAALADHAADEVGTAGLAVAE
jgi:hypothetical protein